MKPAAAAQLALHLAHDPDVREGSIRNHTDSRLSIGSDVWRLTWRGQVTCAVGFDADLHTSCGAVLDALAVLEVILNGDLFGVFGPRFRANRSHRRERPHRPRTRVATDGVRRGVALGPRCDARVRPHLVPVYRRLAPRPRTVADLAAGAPTRERLGESTDVAAPHHGTDGVGVAIRQRSRRPLDSPLPLRDQRDPVVPMGGTGRRAPDRRRRCRARHAHRRQAGKSGIESRQRREFIDVFGCERVIFAENPDSPLARSTCRKQPNRFEPC